MTTDCLTSRIKFVVTVGRRVALLAHHGHILLHHLINLHTQLLVHLLLYQLRVHQQRHHKSYRHQQQDQQHSLPHPLSLVLRVYLVILLYEFYTLTRRIDQRVTNGLENLWGFKKSIEVAVINRRLWVEVNAHFP